MVVGDGVSWEFAQDIVLCFWKNKHEFTQNHLYAGLPTETEHNMSQLYVDSEKFWQRRGNVKTTLLKIMLTKRLNILTGRCEMKQQTKLIT